MLLCSRCKTTRYCNATCQREDWKNHKNQCITQPPTPTPAPTPTPSPTPLPTPSSTFPKRPDLGTVRVPYTCHPLNPGSELELLVYTTPRTLQPDEHWGSVSLVLFEQLISLFKTTQLFLFYYLYFPPPSLNRKAHYTYFSMLTPQGMGIPSLMERHEKFCADEQYTVDVLRSCTIGKEPLHFIVFDLEKLTIEVSKTPPVGLSQGTFNG